MPTIVDVHDPRNVGAPAVTVHIRADYWPNKRIAVIIQPPVRVAVVRSCSLHVCGFGNGIPLKPTSAANRGFQHPAFVTAFVRIRIELQRIRLPIADALSIIYDRAFADF